MGLQESDVLQVIEFENIYLVIKIIEADIRRYDEEISYEIFGYCILAGHNYYLPRYYHINEFVEIHLAYRKETKEFFIITQKNGSIIDRKVYVKRKNWKEAVSFFSLKG